MSAQTQIAPSIIRLKQVQSRVGLSRSTIYQRVSDDTFPKPISLGARAVGWIESEINQWLTAQIEKSRNAEGMTLITQGADPRNEDARRQPGVGQSKNTTTELCYPPASSVKGRTLGALLRGEKITHLDCWRRFGSARLAHHAYILRGIGWPVQMIERTVSTSDAGRPATIGVYSLSPETIAAAGEVGRRYAEACTRIEADRSAA